MIAIQTTNFKYYVKNKKEYFVFYIHVCRSETGLHNTSSKKVSTIKAIFLRKSTYSRENMTKIQVIGNSRLLLCFSYASMGISLCSHISLKTETKRNIFAQSRYLYTHQILLGNSSDSYEKCPLNLILLLLYPKLSNLHLIFYFFTKMHFFYQLK